MTFPTNLAAREAYILAAVSAGDYAASWATLTWTEKGHTIEIDVLADALMIEGCRVNVSARLAQQIADVTGSMLMTPKIADLCHHLAKIRIGPSPQPITASTDAMIAHSKRIDAALAKVAGYDPATSPVLSSIGKYWCLSNKLKGTGTKALNYGWHFEGATYQGIKGFRCDSGLPYSVIQPSATAHDYAHVDYSQIHRTVSAACRVDGERRPLRDVLTDPDLCYLVSHEGPLAVLRQPGVPEPAEQVVVLPRVTITAEASSSPTPSV
jgi:hypothetical protein